MAPMIAGKRKRAKGSDLAPALAGLPDDHCQCPHWGYVVEGEIEVTYQGGARGTVRAGDHCDWPARKVVRVTEDTSDVAFSPVEGDGRAARACTCKKWLRDVHASSPPEPSRPAAQAHCCALKPALRAALIRRAEAEAGPRHRHLAAQRHPNP
jgi:hypothetical protein